MAWQLKRPILLTKKKDVKYLKNLCKKMLSNSAHTSQPNLPLNCKDSYKSSSTEQTCFYLKTLFADRPT